MENRGNYQKAEQYDIPKSIFYLNKYGKFQIMLVGSIQCS